MVSFSKCQVPGGEPSPCVSWEQEVGKLLKMATALSLLGTPGPDSPGPSSVWDPPASRPALSSRRRTVPPLALPGTLCLQEALFRAHLQCWVPRWSLTTCSSLEGGRGPGRGWTWCLVEWMEDRKKRRVGMGSCIQLQKGTDI